MYRNNKKTKNIIYLFAAVLALSTTACGKTDSQISTESSSQSVETKAETDLLLKTTEETTEQASEQNTTDFAGTLYYSGYIGDAEIQMILTVDSEVRVEGEYWYTKYNTPIAFSGFYTDDHLTLSTFVEDSADGSNENFEIMIDSDLSLKGIWLLNDKHYPFYVEQTDSAWQTSVQKPSAGIAAELEEFSGDWYGIHSNYYTNTKLKMIPLYDDLVYFDLFAVNGTHSGEMKGIGKYSDGMISYNEKGYDGEDVYFNFSKDSSSGITMDSNNYQYNCGSNASFEAEYDHDSTRVAIPEEISFLSEGENEALKELTKEYYTEYIKAAQSYDDTIQNLDGFNAKIYNFNMVGNVNRAILMVNTDKNTLMTVIPDYDDEVEEAKYMYFTNDPDYSTPPDTILEWLNGSSYEIF